MTRAAARVIANVGVAGAVDPLRESSPKSLCDPRELAMTRAAARVIANVGVAGFEPTASSSRTKRATKL
ncbi:MAG: hypothetical protein ACOYD1_13350, partial [Candidatus Nanopelagicales bacterium]